MKTYAEWMDEYGSSHQNPTNQMIHKICVPLIMMNVIGILWVIPTPEIFHSVAFLNWSTIFAVSCLIFYFLLNVKVALGMLIQTFIMCFISHKLDQLGVLLQFSVIAFVLAWIAQFYGHKVEGKKPSFLKDIVFLLIGPLWVIRFLYKLLGINV